jgi:post-segregation antitoxin (ccd killing protein)
MTVSLTLNSDLYAQAKRFGINASQIAEEALSQEVARHTAEQFRSVIQRDVEALDAYESKYGSFPEMVREHYGAGDMPAQACNAHAGSPGAYGTHGSNRPGDSIYRNT